MRKAEKESIFRWDSDEKVVHVYSCHPPVWSRVEKKGFTPIKRHFLDGVEIARQYRVPLDCFRYGFRPVDRPRRPAPTWLLKGKVPQKKSGK
jgi:hypothetical protein